MNEKAPAKADAISRCKSGPGMGTEPTGRMAVGAGDSLRVELHETKGSRLLMFDHQVRFGSKH
jgi:hypothetical protein